MHLCCGGWGWTHGRGLETELSKVSHAHTRTHNPTHNKKAGGEGGREEERGEGRAGGRGREDPAGTDPGGCGGGQGAGGLGVGRQQEKVEFGLISEWVGGGGGCSLDGNPQQTLGVHSWGPAPRGNLGQTYSPLWAAVSLSVRISAQLNQGSHKPATAPRPGSGKGAPGRGGPLCSTLLDAQAAERDLNLGLAAHCPWPSGKETLREPQLASLVGETERCFSPRTGSARTISTKAGWVVGLEATPGKVTFHAHELSPPPRRETAWRYRPAPPPFLGDGSADPTGWWVGGRPACLPARCCGQGGARLPRGAGSLEGTHQQEE